METDEIIDVDNYEFQDSGNLNTQAMEINVLENDSEIAEEKKNAGNNEYKAKNYKVALKLYTEAINLCPNVASYYGNRAACHIMLGNCNAALNDSRKAIQLDDTFEKGYIRMCKCLIMLGDIVQSERIIQKYLAINPTSVVFKTELQNIKTLQEIEDKINNSYEKQDYRTTVFHIETALKIATNCQRYKLKKAECLAFLGRIDEAKEIAIAAMKNDPSCPDAIYVRGLCLYYSDDFLEKGLLHFESVLVLDPDHKKAKQMRIKAKSLKEKKEKGNELFKAGKYKEANTSYTEALQIDPLNKDINSKLYYNRALVNSKLGNIKDSIADCTEALKLNPKYLKALLRRARCHYDLEEFQESVRDYESALQIEKTIEIRNALKDAKLALKKSKRKDYYKILGVSKNATEDEIKKAYRKRALVHHPDRHANSTDEEKKEQEKKFKEVDEAYKILSDPNKKIRYDSGQDFDDDNTGGFFFQYFTDGGGRTANFHF